MCQDKLPKRGQFLRRSRWFWICSIIAVGLAFGCGYFRHSQQEFTATVNRAVIEQQLAMERAEEAEQLRLAAEDKVRREKERKEADRLADIEREKWVQVIARTSQDSAELPNQRPKRAINEFSADQISKVVTAGDAGFWSLRPLRFVDLSAEKNDSWSSNPIDQLILAKLHQAGIEPSAPASRRVLARRIWFDMIGLPPTPEDVEAFVNDTAPDSYSRLVERLLTDGAFGERWGRVWLDLARYADSNGYEEDELRPNAFRRAVCRFVGQLRSWHRKQGSPGVCRDVRSPQFARRGRESVGFGLSAGQ
jgi:hypothetical protein